MLTLIILAAVVAAYFGADAYLRRAQNSFRSAERISQDITRATAEFVETSPPPEVAKLAIHLSALAGCGCFVRGMLIAHYLPKGAARTPSEHSPVEHAFRKASSMSPEQQDQLSKLFAMVIVYDSFANPLQGWLFRRLMRSFVDQKPSVADHLEAKLTVLSVTAHRQGRVLAT